MTISSTNSNSTSLAAQFIDYTKKLSLKDIRNARTRKREEGTRTYNGSLKGSLKMHKMIQIQKYNTYFESHKVLHPDLMELVFNCLSNHELAIAAQVCRSWKAVARKVLAINASKTSETDKDEESNYSEINFIDDVIDSTQDHVFKKPFPKAHKSQAAKPLT